MSLQDLQATIDRSLANATPFAKTVFAHDHWDAATIQAFVNRAGGATVATVRRNGRPHAALTLAGCANGTIYFSASDGTALVRNVRNHPYIALTVTEKPHGLMAEGHVRIVGRRSELAMLMEALDAAASRERFVDEDWDGWVCALDVERIFAN